LVDPDSERKYGKALKKFENLDISCFKEQNGFWMDWKLLMGLKNSQWRYFLTNY